MQKYITEECFFTLLSWLLSSCSGIFTSVMIGEICLNFNESQTSFFWYSSCSKTPILWEEEAWSYIMQSLTIITILFITLGCNILIFVRKRQLEKITARGIMVVNYDLEVVTISSRREDAQLSNALKNFNRTVVTPKASFFAFLVLALNYLIVILLYLNNTSSGPSTLGQSLIFLSFSIMFFLNTLVETIFSPSLRNSVIDMFPCLRYTRQAYHGVNV